MIHTNLKRLSLLTAISIAAFLLLWFIQRSDTTIATVDDYRWSEYRRKQPIVCFDMQVATHPKHSDKIKLMINMDMIGRMDSLHHVYTHTDAANSLLIEKAHVSYPDIKLNIDAKNQGNSDHHPFVDKKIPFAYSVDTSKTG